MIVILDEELKKELEEDAEHLKILKFEEAINKNKEKKNK